MRPIISRQNVRTYLKQTFNLNEGQLFDKETVNKEMFTKVTCGLLGEFTKAYYKTGKLTAKAPFTDKEISLTPPDFNSLNSLDDIMHMLNTAYKERMEGVEQNRKEYIRIISERNGDLGLAKKGKEKSLDIER